LGKVDHLTSQVLGLQSNYLTSQLVVKLNVYLRGEAVALKGGTRFSVRFEDVFPAGCVLMPDAISEAQDYNEATRTRTPAVDKMTGERVWTVRVTDMDPDLAGRAREVAVKVTSPVQPVPESSVPFSPVEFEGMTVTPYVGPTGRLTYSLRATGFRSSVPAGRSAK
jgi:hypothetical protein